MITTAKSPHRGNKQVLLFYFMLGLNSNKIFAKRLVDYVFLIAVAAGYISFSMSILYVSF